LGYKLRDKRLKVTEAMTPAQIDKAVDAYRKKFIAWHSDTVARTATLDALKKGQALAWQDAVDRGIVSGDRLFKVWITVGDDRVRDEHAAVNGESVPYNATYSTGEFTPGSSTFNCRCLSRYVQRASA
jgi:hypothetical protein